ncbi:MAG: hypothetical protein WBO46_14300, partial [Caldilineaceae bacterium]
SATPSRASPLTLQTWLAFCVSSVRLSMCFSAVFRLVQPQNSSCKDHAAFGLWRERTLDTLAYEQNLRAEWVRE